MLNLREFLKTCDPNTKVAITNENGIGGASYVAWPEHGWTVGSALDVLGCGGYHVVGVSVREGMLYVEADENPWDFGSYWEGEWTRGEKKGYEVELKSRVCVVEGCEEDALQTAMDMLTSGDAEVAGRVAAERSIEYARDNWGF